MTFEAEEPRRTGRDRFSRWIDAAALGLIVVVCHGLAAEFVKVRRTHLLEDGFEALALREIADGFWSNLPDRIGVALGIGVVLAAVLWGFRRLIAAWPRIGPTVSRVSRRVAVLALLAPALLQGASSLQRLGQPPTAKNVVIVVVDTLRADHLGIHGYDRGTSPRLDALAKDAFVFERARSTSSWTRPAIASLLTSLYSVDHGVFREGGRDRLSRPTPTIQRMLRNHGLHTKAIVAQPHYRLGMDRDFDSFKLQRGDGSKNASNVYDRALDYLDRSGDRPFFLLIHNIDPHDDYVFHKGFSERPKSSKLRTTKGLLPAQEDANRITFDSQLNRVERLDPGKLAELVDNYDGEIRYLDHHFGRLLDKLEARGMMDETLIIVTADHGEEFLDHGSYWHGGTLYDELLRVPLVVRAPGMAGGRIATPVSLVDVLPTVAEWMDVPPLATARGRSLLPLMGGEPAEPRPIFSATGFRRRQILQSVVMDGKKLIRLEAGTFVGLFDLERDPLEQNDLGPDDPSRARLEELLPAPRPPRKGLAPKSLELDPALREALEALGYAVDSDY